MTRQSEPTSLGDILDRLEGSADARDDVSVQGVHEAIGQHSYGPFLLVPALLEISPLGGIPGLPTVLALVIIMFAGQMLLRRERFWIPGVLTKRSVDATRLVKSVGYLRPVARWTDRIFRRRLSFLTKGICVQIGAAVCILLALTAPLLEFVPFASTAPMGAIAIFGLALLVKDGLLMLAAGSLALLALYVGFTSVAG